MSVFVWVMMGIAIWHACILVPDRFYGGIVGAFVGALLGSFIVGVILNGGSIPGESETHLLTGLEGIPGALIGMGIMWFLGVRQERTAAAH